MSNFVAMIQNDTTNLSTQELCDLLAKKTMELLAIIGKERTYSSDKIHDKESEVKMIQSAITQKKSREKHTA